MLDTFFYTWKNYRCACEIQFPTKQNTAGTPLLLIHPIGVGLSRKFWHPFCQEWYNSGRTNPIYNPDLLGCGESDRPPIAYSPEDWARQLQYLIQTAIQKPVILVIQGALFPVGIELIKRQSNLIQGLVLSGPPAWKLMTTATSPRKQKPAWNLFFNTPAGTLFYRYARRRQFLQSFSVRQLFAEADAVGDPWLSMLERGSANLDSRYAVFSFLAGFWRRNYAEDINAIAQPTLAIFGEKTSSISRTGASETAQQRLDAYQQQIPNCRGKIVSGRNIPPYESTAEFVAAVGEFAGRF